MESYREAIKASPKTIAIEQLPDMAQWYDKFLCKNSYCSFLVLCFVP